MAVASGSEDTELARELLSGNAQAFDRFVELFRNRIFQYSYLMCGQRDDAEEVAQDTLLKVFENFDQLREPARVKAWVFRIARNACLMKRRKSIFAPPEELPLDDVSRGTLEPAAGGPGPDEQVIDEEMRRALLVAVRALPPLYRAVVLLRDLEELTTEEAAEILDVSTDVVKTRLHRARAALRDVLAPIMQNAVPSEVSERPRPLNDRVRRQLVTAYEHSRAGVANRD
jgi:RNA polymerase sigma-70 factor, ECF subfamily